MNTSNDSQATYSRQDRQELAAMARRLHKIKRRMLLKSVNQPASPVDNLRNMLLQVALDDTASVSSFESSSSFSESDRYLNVINEE